MHGWPSTQPNRITHNLATAPSCSQPSDSVVCCLGCVQFAQAAMLFGPTSVLFSRRWANVSTTYIAAWLVRLWRGLPIRVTHTTEPAHHHRWSSDAGISRLGHPKMSDAFPGNQLWGQFSPSIGNRHSPDLDYIICIWVGMECDNRIWQKRHILCKRKGNKSRQDAGFSPSWVCHAAGSSIPGCRYLLGDASISSLDFVLTVTHPTYFIHLYIYGLWRRIETFMSSNFPK